MIAVKVEGDDAPAADDATETDAADAADDTADGADAAGLIAAVAHLPAPVLHTWDAQAPVASAPGRDAYALRIVVGRTQYDQGRIVRSSPALGRLGGSEVLRVNPSDAARFGVAEGGEVRITSARGSQIIRAEPDARVPAGLARYDFTADGAGPAELVDAAAPVTDVRVESLR